MRGKLDVDSNQPIVNQSKPNRWARVAREHNAEESEKVTAIVRDLFHFESQNIKKLGSGSTATVFSVTDEQGLRYALKVGRQTAVGKPNEIRMLQRAGLEPRINIDRNGQTYLLMKQQPGLSLESYLNNNRTDKMSIVAAVLMALQRLHEKNIIHRDINLGAIIYDANTNNCGFVDFAAAYHMGNKTYTKAKDPNSNSILPVQMNYYSEVIHIAENVVNRLLENTPYLSEGTAYNDLVRNMKKADIKARYTLPMALVGLSIALIDDNKSALSPLNGELAQDRELLGKTNIILTAIRDYQAHVFSVIRQSRFGTSWSHTSTYPAQNFANDLLNIRSELELYKKLDSFFNTYEGGVKAHSLKVLIASAVLNKQVPSTSEERASLVEEASGFIKLQISSSISNNQANLAEQRSATDEASAENRFIM